MIYGFTPLHYGSDFLKQSLESVKDVVDKYVIAYTKNPSYGFYSQIKCPDTEDELWQIANDVLGNKLEWLSFNSFHHEGQHRDVIYRYAKDDDIVIATDADEIWKDPQGAIEEALKHDVFAFRINGFVNFWKSLDYIVRDGFQPIRIYRPKFSRNTATTINATIYHLGYMISPEAMRYKLQIHGHRNDIDQVHGSPDKYFEKWDSWTKPNCGVNILHPASRDVWKDAEHYEGEKPKL